MLSGYNMPFFLTMNVNTQSHGISQQSGYIILEIVCYFDNLFQY